LGDEMGLDAPCFGDEMGLDARCFGVGAGLGVGARLGCVGVLLALQCCGIKLARSVYNRAASK
jgi:hypothetical protein